MIEQVEVTGLDETLATLRLGNRKHFGEDLDSPWVFRGLRNPNWDLLPKVWRPDFLETFPPGPQITQLVSETMRGAASTTFGAELQALRQPDRMREALTRLFVEYQLLRNFFVIAEESSVQDFSARARDDLYTNVGRQLSPERWIRSSPDETAAGMAQHYGVPTRLLDWSRDPLTALYFALLGDGDDESVIWALHSGAPRRLSRPAINDLSCKLTLIEPPRLLDRRIGSQSGIFTFVQLGEAEFIETGRYPEVSDLVEDSRTLRRYQIKLTPGERVAAKKVLFRERRTMAHLMPDLGSSWEVAKDYYRSGLQF